MNPALLDKITGNTLYADRKAGLCATMQARGGQLNRPHIAAQFLAQILHESGGMRAVREGWGPTKAQVGYEGRRDLGNTQPGDGKRYLGRDLIQITGRANYRALSAWAGYDFEADPSALELPRWLGMGAIWYFTTRDGLMDYAAAGNIEMVTRRVNGRLNGYADRLQWYDRAALALLGVASLRDFQAGAGVKVDGVSGPVTRAAMHKALLALESRPASAPAPVSTASTAEPAQSLWAALFEALMGILKGK